MHATNTFRSTIMVLLLTVVVGNILVGCSDETLIRNTITLDYIFTPLGKPQKVTLIRCEQSPDRYEDIYIDSLPDGTTRRSDTYSIIIGKDSLFMVNMTKARDRMYDRLPEIEKLYEPIFIPTHFRISDWDGDPGDTFYRYFLLQDLNRRIYRHHLDSMVLYSPHRIRYYETAPINPSNRVYSSSTKSPPSISLSYVMGSLTRFTSDVGGCERITNFTFQGIQFDTVLRCEHRLGNCVYVCSKFTQYYTTNYLLIVDSTCSKNFIQPTRESLAKIHALSKRR